MNLAVAQELSAARSAAGFTNESLAAVLPISLSSLQRYLTGRSAIDVEVLTMICRALKVSETDIIQAAGERYEQQTGAPDPAGDLTDEEQAAVDAALNRYDEALRETRPTQSRSIEPKRRRGLG